jgi:hypothetical protein
MTWDATLEANAQAVANTGKFEHSSCVTSTPVTCGENLWEATGFPPLQAIPDWINEKLLWTTCTNGAASLPNNILHYTAMVWTSSSQPKIGCGVLKKSSRSFLVVCHMTGNPIPNTGTGTIRPYATTSCPASFKTMPNAPGTVAGHMLVPSIAVLLGLLLASLNL